MSDSPRTSEPGAEMTRFAERVDLRDADDVPAAECPRCGTPHMDAWMSEGAVSGVLLCVGCGAEPVEWTPSGYEVLLDD